MANKARPPMTTAEEVMAWAEKTRDANGEAFTMLNKEEQLLIAKFLLAMREHIKTLRNTQSMQTPAAPAQPEAEKEVEQPSEQEKADAQEKAMPSAQTNMEYFKANEVSMQRAYELYCVWRNCDPPNRTIFDDERKAWVKAASFAYWLNLPHE